jgi:hypothetical protein
MRSAILAEPWKVAVAGGRDPAKHPMEDETLFNRPTFGYRHQVAAWVLLRRRRRFRSLARSSERRAQRGLGRPSLKFRRLIGLPFVCDGELIQFVPSGKHGEQLNKLQFRL